MNINTPLARRSDLDALRASAMLLGIALHASLSFFPSFWMVSDSRQEPAFGLVFSAIHGFRMPLFFVMSGFFSAMLLHRRGRGALVRHRFRRVFLPLLLGMVTIIPLVHAISGMATSSASSKPAGESPGAEGAESTIWKAADAGDLEAIERFLASGTAVDDPDPRVGLTPLLWAALADRAEAVELLIRRGADVNFAASDGGTPLHGAAFLGLETTVRTLVENGAEVNPANKMGQTPLDNAMVDAKQTIHYASLLRLKVEEDGLGARKEAVASYLREHGAKEGRMSWAQLLMEIPLFSHLWFLWFLWWLVLGYAALSALAAWLPAVRLPGWLVLSPARYLWLVPLTMIPQAYMGNAGASPLFGPDTSTGLLPVPHVLAYYAIFFGFGALYYGCDDPSGRIGARWGLPLALGLLVVLPLGLAIVAGQSLGLDAPTRRALSIALQAAYPWLLTFGLMGLFRRACPSENPKVRYVSDSAYWLYLVHLPLIIAAQHLVRDWPLPAVAKFLLITAAATAFLLWTYGAFVRYTRIGRFLNGPRERPTPAAEAATVT
jgi:peptidoglycan/LPS O-acetylase OafA/YrhL